MGDLLWLPAALRKAGLKVDETAGWKTRETRNGFAPKGVVCHHTASGPNVSDSAMRGILIAGRADLRGPLAQCGLERDGTWVMIAAGRCNHNGFGQWGNDSIGVEAYNDGKGEPWPKVQLDSYTRGVAVICAHYRWGAHRVKGHKETDPKRKIDPVGIDMAKFRRTVTAHLKPSPPTTAQEIAAMKSVIIKGTTSGHWYISDGITKRQLDSPAHAAVVALTFGAEIAAGNQPYVLDQAIVNDITTV